MKKKTICISAQVLNLHITDVFGLTLAFSNKLPRVANEVSYIDPSCIVMTAAVRYI